MQGALGAASATVIRDRDTAVGVGVNRGQWLCVELERSSFCFFFFPAHTRFRVDVGSLDSQPSHPYTHATNAAPLHSQLYFNLDLILYHGEVWRLATNFLYFGNFSIDFIFHMFFLVRYCKVSVGCVMSCSKQLCSDAGCFHRRAPS
jgi:hypothetical protein